MRGRRKKKTCKSRLSCDIDTRIHKTSSMATASQERVRTHQNHAWVRRTYGYKQRWLGHNKNEFRRQHQMVSISRKASSLSSKSSWHRWIPWLLIPVLALSLTTIANAQNLTGTLSGIAQDQ